MFRSTHKGASAYATVAIETGVVAANPHQLIVMLFEGAHVAVSLALQQMRDGDVEGKGRAISKAIMIIDGGLRASLDKDVQGGVAESLDSLYGYMSHRLLIANLRNQPELLEEVRHLLGELKDAWESIGRAPGESQTSVTSTARGFAPRASALASQR
jgi:flagellar protein FliS